MTIYQLVKFLIGKKSKQTFSKSKQTEFFI